MFQKLQTTISLNILNNKWFSGNKKRCLIKWKCEHEQLLAEIGEKCNVYAWFHRKTADMLKKRDNI